MSIVFLAGGGLAADGTLDAGSRSFEARVADELALETERHRVRIDAGPAPANLRAIAAERVWTLLAAAEELAAYGESITPAMLDAEIARMVRQSRDPRRLRAYFAALGDDPVRIKEALVRPVVTRRRLDALAERNADARGWDSLRARYATSGAAARATGPAPLRIVANERGLEALTGTSADSLANDACSDGAWSNGSLDDVPDPRRRPTAVWTGSEMIVFGGHNGETPLASGGRYDPATDVWAPLSNVSGPQKRHHHTAVWTGTEMIVWGGATTGAGGFTNTGHGYDPVTDTWRAIAKGGAPTARRRHTAVWTGTEMIVWGGQDLLGTGGRYNPTTDTWSAVSTVDAPTGRKDHTAVWSGTEMIVWGGTENDLSGSAQNTGGRYDPTTDTWTPTETLGAALPRSAHTAVWSGTAMIVWGGNTDLGASADGGIYDPVQDVWGPILPGGAPVGRNGHVAVWTGTDMVVWGGTDGDGNSLASGGVFDPLSASWTPTTSVAAPDARTQPAGVWTGSELVVWGGIGQRDLLSGGRYDPATDSWSATRIGSAPSPRRGHTATWTGAEVIVWGGSAGADLDDGARYDPATDTWTATTATGAPSARSFHTSVWTGSEMIVWGGTGPGVDTGARYDPVADSWTSTSLTGAPGERRSHSAVWTGSEMIVWGGSFRDPITFQTVFVASGARYDPATDQWSATATLGAPSARNDHTAVWTGSEMIVWGGAGSGGTDVVGGRYDPLADAWTSTSSVGAPVARNEHTAVWTGSEMIVWGGAGGGSGTLASGGRYDPVGDTWSTVEDETAGVPSGRRRHGATWTGSEMVVWGGRIPGVADLPDEFPNDGGRYDPAVDQWTAMTTVGAPWGRNDFGTVWTGSEMVVWGGANGTTVEVASGGRYCACTTSTFFRDTDGDGFGDADETVDACSAPSGFVAVGGDCDDGSGAVWGTPGEVAGVRFDAATTIVWDVPAEPGGTSPAYDVLRSGVPDDFLAATCLGTDVAATTIEDAAVPAAGSAFHYLVRAENACPNGSGTLGDDSNGVDRTGAACP